MSRMPVDMLIPPGHMLVSGFEPEPDTEPQMWRVFVGPRYIWRYVVVGPEEAVRVYREFQSRTMLFARFPDDVAMFQVPREDRDTSPEYEKAMFYLVEKAMSNGGVIV